MKKKKKTGHDDSADLRKRAEEALQQSEENFKALAENANDGILIGTGEEGWHVYANRRAVEITGYPIEELLKTRIKDLVRPDEFPKLIERYKKRLAGLEVPKPYETALVNKDGIEVPIEISPSKTIWQNQLANMVIFRDITERKRAEEALRESEARYKELWERAPVAYHVLDPDGKIAKVNQTEASMLGYQIHEMVGRSIFDFILPEQRDEAQKRFRQKIQGLPIPRIENRIYLKKDGSRIYVVIDDVLERDAHKKVTGIRSTMTDITDRKRIEEELIKSEKKYRSLVETAGSGIAAIDQRGIFTFVNKTLCRMCGYAEQELIGKHFVGFLHPDDRKNVIQIFENAFINPIGNPYIEFRIIHKDGHIVYMCSNPTAFEYEGQLLGFNAIITDITERKRAEEALRESEERYRRLVETAPEVIYNLSAEDGTITLLNPAFEKITGWSRAEWLGKPFMPLVHPDDLTLAMETFQQVSRGEATPPYELRILSKSGEYFIGEFTSFPHIEKRKVIGEFGIARDITERKKAEKEIQNLAKFPSENPNPVLRIARDGLLLYVNEAGVRQLADLHLQVGQATPPMLREVVFQVMENGSAQVLDLEHRERAYSFFVAPVVDAGYANLYGLDITERKRAEEALRKTNAYLDNLFNYANAPIIVWNPQFRISRFNHAFEFLTGRTAGEVLGQTLDLLFPPARVQLTMELIRKTLKGERWQTVEIEILHRDGTVRTVLWNSATLFDSDGKTPIATIAQGQDITERRQAEEVLRRSEENFRRSLDESPLGMRIVSADGETLYANRAILDIYGYASIEELKTTPIKKRYTPESYAEFQIRLEKRRRGEYAPSEYEVSIVRKNGEVRHLQVFRKETFWNSKAHYQVLYDDITERKRAEAALRYQAALLANTHDAIIASDERYRLTAWNAAAESLYGWKAEEVFGRFGLDVTQTEFSGVEKSEMLRTIVEIGHWRGEVTQARKDGTRIPVEVASIVLHDESGRITGYLSVNRDITERKRTEEVLRKSEEKYRTLTENINLGIYRNTVGPEGKFIEANSAIIGMFGYKSKEEFLAINVSDLYQNSEDRNKFNDKMLKEEFVRSEELWLKKKDGSRFIGSVSAVAVKDEQGYVKYYDGIIEDITERKRTEQDLKKSAQLLMDTGEMAKVGAWELDLSAKEVLMTEEVCRIHGVEPGYKPKLEEAIKFYAPESVPALEATLKKTIETGEPYDLESLFIPRGSKDKIWVRSLGRAVYSAGKIVKLAGTFQNIDKYKRAEAAREKLLTELEAQNRELESFVYTVSHDLKAPLVSMSGFSSALKKEYENQLAEKGKHYLERIQANVAQMDSLIANLLELSRIGQVAEPTEGIDVAALLREIRDALAIRLKEAGAKLVVQEPLPTVRADRIRIRQVFVNLIDNAVKFKSAERALRIEVGCRQQSGFHRFHVTDNGIGIPHKYQDQIFAPFQKLHSEIEGVGIGLALVKKIVEHHGGRVWLESPSAKFISSEAEGIGTGNEGAGATFYFTLPIESGVKPLS